ncbi:MAG: undecaprenyl/decaprenyl-phosphate alpha-N-acetylglucosaminyl 1-phosphate transferase [Plectolyngbya sp. WJT66-NPBG17]|jgi:UDP-GlcNAc:undecaprenyl-phosphate GlcNAc-1-phosphate transferase|nr:undecaprenyl/decaprenyl-phosphate alpha-N-acetylglucosaminyl 1-phosphate transferase [Plectolyngbya sp. WJT66-NPBG17]MBW4526849.1 undecaprenyl/decaprenyl-phosphate alpha-N-acetylglucosaminyl 1-phosphate transferase [Phormidium tanganyikae FI6-MK23]
MPFFAAFLISFLVVLAATPIVNRLGQRVGLVDKPNHRKVHKRPMVRLGGVAMFVGVVVALLIVWWAGGFGSLKPGKELEVWGVAIGGIAFFLIGLADDLFNLSPKTRLILQTVVAGLAWQSGVQIDFLTNPIAGLFSLPEWASLPITVIWLVGMANAINWIDGLDGLAAGVSGIAAFVMFWTCLFMQQPQAALFAAALAGATFGFLRYNFNPAQIFMGDGGAYFIGFTLAGVGVIGLVKSVTTVAVLLPYVILAVPILDMSAVIVDRLRRGKSPFVADKRHLHHRLLKAGLSQRLAVLFIYSLTLWAGSLAMAVSGMPSGVGYAIAATIILSVTSWQVWRTAR